MDQRRIHARGRSRQVSNIALARKASEERHAHHKPRHTAATGRPRSPVKPTETNPPRRSLIPSPPSSSATSAQHSRSPSPQLTSASVSPANSVSPASPLDTGESLEDQLHMAYALDNMDLCKIIFLKLKGITITGADDPRLAAVQPEDFDECFLPNGSLMESEDDWAPVEAKREQERQRLGELRRAEEEEAKLSKQATWETTAENRWHVGQKKYKVAKIHWQRLREEEDKRTLNGKEEPQSRESSERSRRRAKAARLPLSHIPPRLSYDSLNINRSARPVEAPLIYPSVVSSTMQIPKRRVTSRQSHSTAHVESSRTPTSSALASSLHTISNSNSSPASSSCSTSPVISSSDAIPFKVVVASMRGRIFPPDPLDRQRTRSHSGSLSSSTRSEKKSEELLDSLLQPVEWQEGEHILRQSRKGKEREIPLSFANRRPSLDSNKCAACLASVSMSPGPSRSNTSSTLSSIASSTSSSGRASSFFSRRGSWLSFGSSGSISSTVPTTPSSSPSVGSWFKSPTAAPAILSPVMESISTSSYQCTCSRPYSRLTPIPASAAPLSLEPAKRNISNAVNDPATTPAIDSEKPLLTRAESWSVHMGKLVALAKGFQTAYVGAVVFAAVPSLSADWDDHSSERRSSRTRSTGRYSLDRKRLSPPGYRACAADVAIFLLEDSMVDQSQGPTKSIPLLYPFPPMPPQSTILPSALPYELRFKRSIPPTPSPMKRFAQMAIAAQSGRVNDTSSATRSMSPPRSLRRRSSSLSSTESTRTGPVPRARFVPNPVYLRLRAIQNIVGRQSMGYGPDGTYSCGRERLVGVAFEEIGRSGLCVEEHAYLEQQKVTYGRDMGVFSARR